MRGRTKQKLSVMKKLFFISLLALMSWQTGLCRSEIHGDDASGSTGTQTLCGNDALENAPVWELIPGETDDSFCALYAWNPTPNNVRLKVIFRYYNEYTWYEYTFEMSAYRDRYRETSFPKRIVIDKKNSEYSIIEEGPALDYKL